MPDPDTAVIEPFYKDHGDLRCYVIDRGRCRATSATRVPCERPSVSEVLWVSPTRRFRSGLMVFNIRQPTLTSSSGGDGWPPMWTPTKGRERGRVRGGQPKEQPSGYQGRLFSGVLRFAIRKPDIAPARSDGVRDMGVEISCIINECDRGPREINVAPIQLTKNDGGAYPD